MIDGILHLFGHDLNTDVIHPPEYFSLDRSRVQEGLMKGVDPDFLKRFRPGDVLVGGENFGCGSSRETSVYSMLENRVGAVVAISFARIFFRNAVNNRLPVFELADPHDFETLSTGRRARIDPSACAMTCDGRRIELRGVPPALKRWLELDSEVYEDGQRARPENG